MNEVRRCLVRGLVRGTVAAMAMTGVRQVTTGLGLVEQTPPEAIIKQRAPGLLVRMPRLAFFRDADKRPEDATTVSEIVELYQQQGAKPAPG
jgi:hypothetical protein